METPRKLTAKQLAAEIWELTKETLHPRRWASRRTVLDWIQMRTIVFTRSPQDFDAKVTGLLGEGWRVTPGTFAAQAVTLRTDASPREKVHTDVLFFVELEKVDPSPSN